MPVAPHIPSQETFFSSQDAALEKILQSVKNSPLLDVVARQYPHQPYYWDSLGENTVQAYSTDPGLISGLINLSVEGLHATRSGSLLSILQHGIMPASLHDHLDTPVISGEHYSQQTPRKVVHFVHWLYAGGTQRFAEDAITDNSDSNNLSIHNYKEALRIDDAFIQQIDPTLAIRTHFERRKAAAKKFDEWLQSGNTTEAELELHTKNIPVLLGFSMEGIDTTLITAQPRSHIKGDLTISQTIPSENVKLIAAPESSMAEIQKYIPTSGDISLVALERMRGSIPAIY